jgi:hypothetical protein
LPDFSWSKRTRTEKVYQMSTNYTKLPYIIPNGHKLPVYQTAVKYTKIFHSKTLLNIPKLGFFGLKINHLATLITTESKDSQDIRETVFYNTSLPLGVNFDP